MAMERAERNWWIKWSVALAVAVVISLFAARLAYFPGDVAFARFVQAVLPADTSWAQAVSRTASAPWNYVWLVVTVLVAWWPAGCRAALLGGASFMGLWFAGPWLQNLIGRPRPSAALIHVVGAPTGPSFPSISALTYAATFGYLATLTFKQAGALNRAIFFISLLALVLMALARVMLGAHWPSDVLGGYLLGFVWTSLLVKLARGVRRAENV